MSAGVAGRADESRRRPETGAGPLEWCLLRPGEIGRECRKIAEVHVAVIVEVGVGPGRAGRRRGNPGSAEAERKCGEVFEVDIPVAVQVAGQRVVDGQPPSAGLKAVTDDVAAVG